MSVPGSLALATTGRSRSVLIVLGSAVVSGLLMVAVAVVRLGVSRDRSGGTDATAADYHVFVPLQSAGTRGGMALGVVLMTVPLLALLNQILRFGSTKRQRRDTSLHLVGATGTDLRWWGAIQVAAPAMIGAVLGIAVWWSARHWLGEGLATTSLGGLVPAQGPGWWAAPVILGVAVLGVLTGLRVPSVIELGRDAIPVSPDHGRWNHLGRSSRWSSRARRTTRAVLVAALVGASAFAFRGTGTILLVVAAWVLVVALWLTPALVRVSARLLGRGQVSASRLLAARRLHQDPAAAARAVLATGVAGIAVGVCAEFLAELQADAASYGGTDYRGAVVVVLVLAGLALVLVGVSMAVHIADNLVTHHRSYAPLWAAGLPRATLDGALRWEAIAVTLPVTTLGAALGALAYGGLLTRPTDVLLPALIAVAAAAISTAIISVVAVAALSPVVRRTISTEALRTE